MIAFCGDLAERTRRLPARAGTTRVVAVDGPAGGGKTTFANRLAPHLGAPVLHLDDICPGWEGLQVGKAVANLIERGISNPREDTLARLGKVLGARLAFVDERERVAVQPVDQLWSGFASRRC